MILYTDKQHVPFQIDEDGYEAVRHYCWSIAGAGYVTTHVGKWPNSKPITLHQFLLGPAPPTVAGQRQEWDHGNRDPLDNQRNNLRPATRQQNSQNRAGYKKLSHARGIFWDKARGRWQAQIKIAGRSRYLGLFASEAEAASAAQQARETYMPFSKKPLT